MGAGLVMLTAGLLWFTQVSPHGTYLVDLAPGFLLAGLGLGFSFIPVTIAALEGITDAQAGLASGLINTSQQIGGALGVALLTTVLTNYTLSHGGQSAAPHVFTDGLSRAFLVGAGLAVIAFIANLLLVRAAVPEQPGATQTV
jgi:MFS family permease